MFKELHFRALHELTGLKFDFRSETATFGEFIEELLDKKEDYDKIYDDISAVSMAAKDENRIEWDLQQINNYMSQRVTFSKINGIVLSFDVDTRTKTRL